MKKLLRNISLISLLLISCFAFVVSAYADEGPDTLPKKKEIKNIVLIIHKGETAEEGVYFPVGTKLSKIKVSQKSIKVKKETRDGIPYLSIRAKKAVKGKVSLTAAYKGKKQNYKIKVTAVKYRNPFKSFKIGKTDYAKKFKKEAVTFTLKKGVSGKLSIKMNKGFKLDKLWIDERPIKNNSKITLDEGSMIALTYFDKSLPKNNNIDGFLIPLEVLDSDADADDD